MSNNRKRKIKQEAIKRRKVAKRNKRTGRRMKRKQSSISKALFAGKLGIAEWYVNQSLAKAA